MKLWVALLVLGAAACRSPDPAAATLVSHSGEVARSPDLAAWEGVTDGARFAHGQAARTSAASTANLDLGGARLTMAERTVIRFGRGGPGASGLELSAGEAVLEAGTEGIVLELGYGRARLEGSTRVRLVGGPAARFEVLVGRATLDRGNGEETLEAGAVVEVSFGAAELEPPSDATPDTATVMVDAAGVDAAAVDTGVAPAVPHDPSAPAAPDHADLVVRAGESSTIHDPRPPTAVGIDASGVCPSGAVVELDGRRVPGPFFVPAGGHRYRVRCMGAETVIEGRLVVRRDSGTRPLARHAPRNVVDADGRRYTLLYQNQLPVVTFRWPKPPAGAGPYRLVVESDRRKPIEEESSTARVTLSPEQLTEGSYRFYFESHQGKSPVATLRIDFDNAAGSAYLRTPGVTERWESTVELTGGSLPGWEVSLDGTPVPTDARHRFAVTVDRTGRFPSVAVRLVHPVHGVHYYVRRGR